MKQALIIPFDIMMSFVFIYSGSIPAPEEILEGDTKRLIEYRREDDGKLVKVC